MLELELADVSVRYGARAALRGVDFAAAAGEIHALLGENGAGKTTLVRVACGEQRVDAGTLSVGGRPVALRSPRDAARLGIGIVHQHDALVDDFTVAENLELGRADGPALLTRRRLLARARAAAERSGLALPDLDRRAADLSLGERLKVELARALLHGARALLLDEATAVLTPKEAEALLAEARRLARAGAAVVLVTHRLAEVLAAADRVTVLRGGRVVASRPRADVDAARLAQWMVGAAKAAVAPRPAVQSARARLEIRGLSTAPRRAAFGLAGVALAVRGGEIAGIAGVDGNGQSELVECIVGLERPAAGAIAIDGAALPLCDPAAARAAGLAVVPVDRQREGLALGLAIDENLHLAARSLAAVQCGPLLSRRRLRAHAAELAARFGIRGGGLGEPASVLSGGNQQRVVLARELERAPSVLLLANPTRGLDVAATVAVHGAIREAAALGAAVLLVSSDLDEVLELCDRVLVLFRGRIAAEFPRGAERAAVGAALAGGAP